jgi:hypothetical protein
MGWPRRIGIALLALGLVAAVPIVRNETTCMRARVADAAPYQPLLPAESRRNGVDTFLTYPEWSIVHAYDDLAGVTKARGEEHFGYLRAVRSYWSSLCSLSRIASSRGEIALDMKAMLYIIGVSFSGEMAVKGLYETTVGRLTAWLRGPERTPDDRYAIRVAEDYAAFLRQTPWYEYPFWTTLRTYWTETGGATPSLVRTVERRIALSLEWSAKAVYAKAMGNLAAASPARLTLQTIVVGMDRAALAADPDVTIKGERPEGIIVETPRYRAYTEFLQRVAAAGGSIREIAGNDRIFVTVVSDGARRAAPGATGAGQARFLFSVPVQAAPGRERLGLELPVADLAAFIRAAPTLGLTFEHAYDY